MKTFYAIFLFLLLYETTGSFKVSLIWLSSDWSKCPPFIPIFDWLFSLERIFPYTWLLYWLPFSKFFSVNQAGLRWLSFNNSFRFSKCVPDPFPFTNFDLPRRTYCGKGTDCSVNPLQIVNMTITHGRLCIIIIFTHFKEFE